MEGILQDLLITSLTSMSGRVFFLVCKHPSSVAARWRSKRNETDFFLKRGLSLKKEPSHSLMTSSTFSVLKQQSKYIYDPLDNMNSPSSGLLKLHDEVSGCFRWVLRHWNFWFFPQAHSPEKAK